MVPVGNAVGKRVVNQNVFSINLLRHHLVGEVVGDTRWYLTCTTIATVEVHQAVIADSPVEIAVIAKLHSTDIAYIIDIESCLVLGKTGGLCAVYV